MGRIASARALTRPTELGIGWNWRVSSHRAGNEERNNFGPAFFNGVYATVSNISFCFISTMNVSPPKSAQHIYFLTRSV